MSGQDILDQAAGTTPFVHDYLHITGTAPRRRTTSDALRHGVAGNPVTDGIGTGAARPDRVLSANFMDEITPNGGALRRSRMTASPTAHRSRTH